MKTRIVRIGNSQGLRLPRPLLEAAGLEQDAEVEIESRPGELVIRPVAGVRAGWDAAFAAMAAQGDDALLDTSEPTRFDRSDWTW
jgi:antitoxin MazE